MFAIYSLALSSLTHVRPPPSFLFVQNLVNARLYLWLSPVTSTRALNSLPRYTPGRFYDADVSEAGI